jgi:GNAT superfamily N-acetyltransferase
VETEDLVRRTLQDDPMFVFIQPDDARRRRLLGWYVPALLKLLRAKGRVDVAPGPAAALWVPPAAKVRPPLISRVDLVTAPFRLGLSATQRAMEFAAAVDEASRGSAADAWLLVHVSVEPDRRARGLAAGVMKRTLDEADAADQRAFVAATSEPAVGFLTTQGFEVEHHLRVEGLPQFWTMVRSPL